MNQSLSKSDLRIHLKQKRHDFHISCDQLLVANQLKETFLQHIPLKPHQKITGYLPINSEISPLPLLQYLESRGYTLGMPKVENDTLIFLEWASTTPLAKGNFGTLEPSSGNTLTPDIILMPLLGFDEAGNRLGYGRGHYDKALATFSQEKTPLKIGLAYNIQRLDYIPAESHDEKLDWVITPTRAWKF